MKYHKVYIMLVKIKNSLIPRKTTEFFFFFFLAMVTSKHKNWFEFCLLSSVTTHLNLINKWQHNTGSQPVSDPRFWASNSLPPVNTLLELNQSITEVAILLKLSTTQTHRCNQHNSAPDQLLDPILYLRTAFCWALWHCAWLQQHSLTSTRNEFRFYFPAIELQSLTWIKGAYKENAYESHPREALFCPSFCLVPFHPQENLNW